MPLLGRAAVVIWSDMPQALLAQHDAWHEQEHLPERMGVPGFLRGRRCAATAPGGQPRFILYEIRDIAVSTSAPYLERLDNPTPWSRRIMAECRLVRSLCRVAASHGDAAGAAVLTARWPSGAPGEDFVRSVLERPGVLAAHLLQRDAVKPVTKEEKLRKGGADGDVEWVALVEGAADALVPIAADIKGAATSIYTTSQVMTA